jgi:hypothetical protein
MPLEQPELKEWDVKHLHLAAITYNVAQTTSL